MTNGGFHHSTARDYPEAGRREKHFDNDVDNQDGRLNFQCDLSHIRGQNGCITIVTGDGREGFIQGKNRKIDIHIKEIRHVHLLFNISTDTMVHHRPTLHAFSGNRIL